MTKGETTEATTVVVPEPTLDLPLHDPDWAWAEYQPDKRRPWTLTLVGHLYRRAGFGPTSEQLEQGLEDGPKKTVSRLVREPDTLAEFQETFDRDVDAVARSGGTDSLRAWWLRRILDSPFPLQEKMTLFWHSHFGVANRRVKDAGLMMRHVRTLRQFALGSYRDLLESVAKDPAVLLAVDASSSRKARPNENFSQQLMDQFSLGPGNYGAEDVREAARAMTGWFVFRGQLRYLEHEHDVGTKRVLGQAGRWTREDVIRIVLSQPATPRNLARRLYRWFVSEVDQPDSRLIDPLAKMLADQYQVGGVVERILRSNLLYSTAAIGRRVKSPVEFATGIVHAFGGRLPTVPLAAALADMGQSLYDPPTVKGWSGGKDWLNAVTLVQRRRLAGQLLSDSKPYEGRLDVDGWIKRRHLTDRKDAAEELGKLLLGGGVPDSLRHALSEGRRSGGSDDLGQWVRKAALQLIQLPEFQLG